MTAGPNSVAVGGFVADLDSSDDSRITVKVTGWDDGPPIRSGITARPQADGGFDAPGLYSPRVIGVEGVVDTGSAVAAQAIADELSALSPRDTYQFVVDKVDVGTRSATVRVTQRAVLEWVGGSAFTYTMQLTAPDHLRYGPAWFGSTTMAGTSSGSGFSWPLSWPWDWGVPAGVTPGSLFVPNDGLASYWAKLRIDGPVPNPVVGCVETGDSIRWGGTLTTGQWIDLDTGERHVTFGANQDDVRYLVQASGLWLVVPPGGATFTFDADTADPAAKLSVFGYEGAWD